MTTLLIVEPIPPVAIGASRGSGVANLVSADPKEVWADDATPGTTTITVDLGAVRRVDTIFLGYLRQASVEATWTLTGGVADPSEVVLQVSSPLRVPDSADDFASLTHALWFGDGRNVRYVSIAVSQPFGSARLTAGALVIGAAFAPALGQEWGFGRQPIDSGEATDLPSGGFAVVEGVRKRAISWTFGDLSIAEADRLERIALSRGSSAPVLVIEDAARTTGLRDRLHYGLFQKWKANERRNRKQTRWELGLTEWV